MENENLNKTKENMIKKCKKIGDVLETGFWFFIIILIVFLIIGIMNAIVFWEEGASSIEIINELTYMIRDLFNIDTDFSDINSIKETIIGMIVSILSFVVLHALSKIFINTAKDETPFSMTNIKNMRKISICAYIVFFITLFSSNYGLGAIYVIAIGGIEYIFRYGYKLQIESDETL